MTSVATSNERAVKALLGTKLGMTQVWDANGVLRPVTVLEVGSNVVTQINSSESGGYNSVQLAYGQIDPRKVTKPLKARFEKLGIAPRRHVTEIRTSDATEYSVGQELDATIFEAGQKVDVTGTTKGKGTAGVMKRHGFAGAGASHGQHRNHRKAGSIGGASYPGRVFRGQKMAGRMGNARQTTQNLTVVGVDADRGILLIAGAVPGPKGGVIVVRSAVKGA